MPLHNRGNAFLHFIASEMWAALASVTVYALFRFAAYLMERIDHALPIKDHESADFLQFILHWGAAIGAGSTFIVITSYQLYALLRRLTEE